MIVRNESNNLPRLFASLSGVVDYYVISDTGSTDDTIAVIQELGARYGITGEVTRHEWVDFAHNRNMALEDAIASRQAGRHHCPWLMVIDADEELVSTRPDWQKYLSEGTSYYTYKKTGSAAWAHLFLVWIDGQSWRWQGKVHNYLLNDRAGHPKEFLLDTFIRYHVFEGAKSHGFADRGQKALADARLLEAELLGQEVNPGNLHRFSQLAGCYAMARDEEGALRVMGQVLASGVGSTARRYSARIFMAELLSKKPGKALEALGLLDEAIRMDPARKEAMFYKALLLRKEGKAVDALTLLERAAALPWPKQGYYMWEEPVYAWRIDYERAFLYFQQGNPEAAAGCIRKLRSEALLPDAEKVFIDALAKRLPLHLINDYKTETGK